MYVFDYVKMNTVLKLNFLLNIDTLILYQSPIARIVICDTLGTIPSFLVYQFHMHTCPNPYVIGNPSLLLTVIKAQEKIKTLKISLVRRLISPLNV